MTSLTELPHRTVKVRIDGTTGPAMNLGQFAGIQRLANNLLSGITELGAEPRSIERLREEVDVLMPSFHIVDPESGFGYEHYGLRLEYCDDTRTVLSVFNTDAPTAVSDLGGDNIRAEQAFYVVVDNSQLGQIEFSAEAYVDPDSPMFIDEQEVSVRILELLGQPA